MVTLECLLQRPKDMKITGMRSGLHRPSSTFSGECLIVGFLLNFDLKQVPVEP
jgi:hypothetical protein